jgi:hypothetical protein
MKGTLNVTQKYYQLCSTCDVITFITVSGK